MSAKEARLVFVLVLSCGIARVEAACADASGCSRDFSLGTPSQAADSTPNCAPGGDGCYECAYDHRNLSGYDICAEPVDPETEGAPICEYDVAQIPSWWPDPVTDTSPPPDDPPPPGDSNPSGTGDDGGVGPDPGGGGGGGDGGPYYYAYSPPAYLYSAPHHRPYNPDSP